MRHANVEDNLWTSLSSARMCNTISYLHHNLLGVETLRLREARAKPKSQNTPPFKVSSFNN